MLVKKFTVIPPSNVPIKDNGIGKPEWLNNYKDKSNWYFDNNITYYFLNREEISPNHVFFNVQYGQNADGWGSVRFFDMEIQVTNEVRNNDNSIDCVVTVIPNFYRTQKTDFAEQPGNFSYDVEYNITLGDTVFYTYTGTSFDEIDYTNINKVDKKTINIHIKPQETLTTAMLKYTVQYPNGEFETTNTLIGVELFNSYPALYVPMAVRKSGSMKPLNNHESSEIKIRKTGVWQMKKFEEYATMNTENKGHNRIRKSGKWLQLPPMK